MESIRESGKDAIHDSVIEWAKSSAGLCGESLRDARIRVDTNWGGRRCAVAPLE